MRLDQKTLPIEAARMGIAPLGYSDESEEEIADAWRYERNAVQQVTVALDTLSSMARVPIYKGLTSEAIATLFVRADFRVSNGAVLVAAHFLEIPLEKIRRLPGVARLGVNEHRRPIVNSDVLNSCFS